MLTKSDMMHLARLSRLAPAETVLEQFAPQCDKILQYMDVLAEVPTEGVEPLYSPAEHVLPQREDKAEKRRTRDEVLANAPETDGRFFVVPRIV